MNTLSKYYISRIFIAIAFGALARVTGASWPTTIGFAVGALAIFLYLPKSGRYLIQPRNSIAPFREDEFGRAIRNRAARDGFVLLTLGFFVLHLYAAIAKTVIPASWFDALFVVGWLAYLISDFWRRRA